MSGQQQHGWLAICGPLNRKADVPTIRCLPLPFMEKRADRAVSVRWALTLLCPSCVEGHARNCNRFQNLNRKKPKASLWRGKPSDATFTRASHSTDRSEE